MLALSLPRVSKWNRHNPQQLIDRGEFMIQGSVRTLLSSLLLAAAFSSPNANASDSDIQLGTPGFGGTGCRNTSASVTLAPDQKSLSILFDEYVVEAGNGRRMDRKSCNIAIPVHIPQGYSVSLFKIDYRGFGDLPRGARAAFNVEYFFAGSSGVRTAKNFVGPASGNYEMTDELEAQALVWSKCGEDTNLRVNTSMVVNANTRGDLAMATVDSADVTAGLVYHIAWKRCP